MGRRVDVGWVSHYGKEVGRGQGRRKIHPPYFPSITQGRDCKNTNIFSPRAERCFWTQKV